MMRDRLPGGRGDNRPDSDFNAVQLKRGIEVELEHTSDVELAKEIAKDHLSEDPLYYVKLNMIHTEAKKRKKKKCKWPYDVECDWMFAPFFGKDKDDSAAVISTARPGSKSGTGRAYPGAGGINMPGVPGGPGIPNSGMGPMITGKKFSGNSLVSDCNYLSALTEAQSKEDAMAELAIKYLDRKTRYKIVDKKMSSGYLLGYEKGSIIEIERDMVFPKGARIGNFLQRQVNLSVPNQRIQTAVKVKDVIKDVIDGTFLVNNNHKDTKDFIRLAKEALK